MRNTKTVVVVQLSLWPIPFFYVTILMVFVANFCHFFALLDLLDAASRGLNGHISCLIASNYVTFRLDE